MLLIKNARQVVSPHPSEVPLSGERLGDLNILSKTDIAIEDETIVEIGHNLDYPDAIILDASDMVVVPGFVVRIHIWFLQVQENMN